MATGAVAAGGSGVPSGPALRLVRTAEQGRHWVAVRDIPAGTAVLSAAPYAAAVFDSARRRVCAVCLRFAGGGREDGAALPFHCAHCDAVYCCSARCLARLLGDGAHPVVCAALRRLAAAKLDPHARSVAKLALLALAARLADSPARYWTADPLSPVPGGISVPRFRPVDAPASPVAGPLGALGLHSPQGEAADEDECSFYAPGAPPGDAFARARLAWDNAEKSPEPDSPAAEVLEERPLPPADLTAAANAQPAVLLTAPPPPSANPSPGRPHGARGNAKNARAGAQRQQERPWERDPVDLDKLERSRREAWELAERGTWRDVLQLQGHAREWTKEEVNDWRRTIHHHLLPLLAASSLLPPALVGAPPARAERFLLDLVSAIESNAFGIWTSGRPGVNCGRGIWLAGVPFVNHSCEANCEVVQGLAVPAPGGTTPDPDASVLASPALLRVIATRDIPSGAEITISYVDVNAPLSARRERLAAEYHFRCSCGRCQREERQGSGKVTYERSFARGQNAGHVPRHARGRNPGQGGGMPPPVGAMPPIGMPMGMPGMGPPPPIGVPALPPGALPPWLAPDFAREEMLRAAAGMPPDPPLPPQLAQFGRPEIPPAALLEMARLAAMQQQQQQAPPRPVPPVHRGPGGDPRFYPRPPPVRPPQNRQPSRPDPRAQHQQQNSNQQQNSAQQQQADPRPPAPAASADDAAQALQNMHVSPVSPPGRPPTPPRGPPTPPRGPVTPPRGPGRGPPPQVQPPRGGQGRRGGGRRNVGRGVGPVVLPNQQGGNQGSGNQGNANQGNANQGNANQGNANQGNANQGNQAQSQPPPQQQQPPAPAQGPR